MSLNYKAMGMNIGALAAGAWGMAVFAQTNAVDLYALIGQLKKIYSDLVVTGSMLAPFILAGVQAYRTWGMKQVPKQTFAVIPHDVPVNPDPAHYKGASISGTVVGALLFVAILFLPGQSVAGPIADKIAADVATVRATIIGDLTAAQADARDNSDPSMECWNVLLQDANKMPVKLMGVAHTVQRARTLRRRLPAILDACAVVRDGARQAILQIFGAAAGGLAGLAALGL